MAALHLESIHKQFDGKQIIRDVSLDIASGEFVSILGPSGCGKTTLLRSIAGLERPDSGQVILDGSEITSADPQERQIGMVFQNYALFPHLTVFENVAFGLKTRKVARETVQKRAGEMLEAVGLSSKLNARVPTLSGGEQQRVALARALVIEPKLMLFDEPLSNLDVSLRLQMREEIRRLQRTFGFTAVYVTHDQAEAMSLSHRLAVMRNCRIEQVGAPELMYRSPATPFVDRFLGGANVVRTTVTNGAVLFGRERCAVGTAQSLPDGPILLSIKPEAVLLRPPDPSAMSGTIVDRDYLGFLTSVVVDVGGVRLQAVHISSTEKERWDIGTKAGVALDWSGCSLFPPEGE